MSGMAVVRALCCECGRVARLSVRGPYHARDEMEDAENGRCLIHRKCINCDGQTPHAYLLDDAETWQRDYAENNDAIAWLGERLQSVAAEVMVREEVSTWDPVVIVRHQRNGHFSVAGASNRLGRHRMRTLLEQALYLIEHDDDPDAWTSDEMILGDRVAYLR